MKLSQQICKLLFNSYLFTIRWFSWIEPASTFKLIGHQLCSYHPRVEAILEIINVTIKAIEDYRYKASGNDLTALRTLRDDRPPKLVNLNIEIVLKVLAKLSSYKVAL